MSEAILIQLNIWFGSIGVTISIFFGTLLLIRKDRARSNLFLAIYLFAFALRIGKSLFHNYFEISPTLRTYILCVLFCIGPSIWLFTKHLINREGQFSFFDGLHYALFIVMLPLCWFIPNNGSLAFILFYNATIFHMLGYTLYSAYSLYKAPKGIGITADSTAHRWLQAFLGVNLITIIGYFLISQEIIPFYLGLAFLYSITMVIFSAWGLKVPQLFASPVEKYQASHLRIDQSAQLFEQLQNLMEAEKPYLDPALSLSKLSQQVRATPKEVSQAINQVEQLNYSQFISRYRVEEAQRLLQSPAHSPFKIAAIAYDSGFNSLSSFNLQFKKHTEYHPYSTLRAFYVAKYQSGDPQVPAGMEAVQWMPIEEAIRKTPVHSMKVITEQLLNFPDAIWGESFMVYREGEERQARLVEAFYPLAE